MPKPLRALIIMTLAVCGLICTMSDAQAQITWRRTYGGFGSDQAASVRQVSDGGYIVTGSTGSFGFGSSDMYVLRLDELGAPMWSRTYGGIGVENGATGRELADGFIVAGTTGMGPHGGYDMMLVRTDAEGYPLWERFHGTSDWDLLNAMDVLDDGFILGGTSYGMGYPKGSACLIRTDLEGQEVWRTSIGGAHKMECNGVVATSDGGFVVVGRTGSELQDDNGFFSKLDALGNEVWTTSVGGDSADYLISVIEMDASGYVALGGTRSQSNSQQIYMVMVDLNGELLWERFIGSVVDAGGTEVALGHDGSLVFTGYNTLNLGNRDMILTRTNHQGWWQQGANFGNGRTADGFSVDTTDDGGYIVAGWAEGFGPGVRALYVVKTDQDFTTASLNVSGYADPLPVEEVRAAATFAAYPNPVLSGAELFVPPVEGGRATWRLHDLSGRQVALGYLMPGERSIRTPELLSGSYLLEISGAQLAYRSVARVIIEGQH